MSYEFVPSALQCAAEGESSAIVLLERDQYLWQIDTTTYFLQVCPELQPVVVGFLWTVEETEALDVVKCYLFNDSTVLRVLTTYRTSTDRPEREQIVASMKSLAYSSLSLCMPNIEDINAFDEALQSSGLELFL